MNETIIPGIRDGLKASGRQDEPPIILRSHDTDGPRVLHEALPLYKNIYTMSKYTGESLTTYQPGGPWGETHQQLAAAAPIHIENVHILANLEPWRWASPTFVKKTMDAMHRVHHAKGLHLYPQASYWDWPYTADKLPNGERMLQIDRDKMWYAVWGRYAWKNEHTDDMSYWQKVVAQEYGTDEHTAQQIIKALDESGEIAPKLLRRFGITEGNRQCLLLGMKISQLVNPYKYTIYPGFYESCGPAGEKLIEYVEKEWKGEKHHGELPLDIVEQCVKHGDNAVEALKGLSSKITRNKAASERTDRNCANAFARSIKGCAYLLNNSDSFCSARIAVPSNPTHFVTRISIPGLTAEVVLSSFSMTAPIAVTVRTGSVTHRTTCVCPPITGTSSFSHTSSTCASPRAARQP